jgi:hypothetical protein
MDLTEQPQLLDNARRQAGAVPNDPTSQEGPDAGDLLEKKAHAPESARDSVATDGDTREHTRRTAYHMIETFSADNFRGFRELRLKGLKTINIIVGGSGTGKTALLEALRVGFAGTPGVAWGLAAQRGILVGIPANPTRKQFEAPWTSFFYEFNTESMISFSATDSDNGTRSCKVFFDLKNPIGPVYSSEQLGSPMLPEAIYPLVFARTSDIGEESIAIATVAPVQQPQFMFGGQISQVQPTNFQMQMPPAPELGPICELFQANAAFNMAQTAQKYSDQSISGNSVEIAKTLMSAFPKISSLQSEIPTSGPQSLYVTIDQRKHKIPLTLYSAGISKFVTLVVEIQSRGRSVILIDEIENGIWFKMMPSLWSVLHKFATKYDTQLFVSTHSLESLKAAMLTAVKHPDDFSLIQTSQDDNGNTARVASGDDMAAAIESGIELRR